MRIISPEKNLAKLSAALTTPSWSKFDEDDCTGAGAAVFTGAVFVITGSVLTGVGNSVHTVATGCGAGSGVVSGRETSWFDIGGGGCWTGGELCGIGFLLVDIAFAGLAFSKVTSISCWKVCLKAVVIPGRREFLPQLLR